MKQKLLFSFLILCCLNAFGQKEYNVWYFGDKAGITFNTDPSSVLTDGQLNTFEASSGVCDENGNLLFYTDGDTVWNQQHQIMPNGISPIDYFHTSGIQGAIVIKKPFSISQYYIFCPIVQERISNTPFVDYYLRYWVVDMSLNNGLGGVVEANKPLLQNGVENVAITLHANGEDIWVGTIEEGKNKFNCIQTENGIFSNINKVVKSDIGVPYGTNYSKFSPNGAVLYCGKAFVSAGTYAINLYHFDNGTGKLSDGLTIVTKEGASRVVEFSHDSRFLYVVEGNTVVQYDLSIWNKDSIEGSAVIIRKESYIVCFQLGPDSKIYAFKSGSSFVSVIDLPAQKGIACDFLSNNIHLLSGKINSGGPYYPTFWINRLHISLKKELILCENDSAILNGQIPNTAKVLWSTGDTTNTIVCKQPGLYWVLATLDGDTAIDSINVRIGKKPTVYIGSDTAFCGAFSHLMNAGKGKKEYLWNTGDTTYAILVNVPDMYSVTIKDSNSCEAADSVDIGQLLNPDLSIIYDSVTCSSLLLKAPQRQKGIEYFWSTGDTTESILVTQKGQYFLTAKTPFCSSTSSILIDRLKLAQVNLGADTGFCGKFSYTLNAGGGTIEQYNWNTGSTDSSISINQPGTYSVTVSDSNSCKASDTVIVDFIPAPVVSGVYDSIDCNYTITLDTEKIKGISYTWNTGDTTESIVVSSKGEYTMTASNRFCGISGSVFIDEFPMPRIDLGKDSNLCDAVMINITAPSGYAYLWSTNEQTPTIKVSSKGQYWVVASRKNCVTSDTVNIIDVCNMRYFIPNAFSPSGDKLNDMFRVAGENIERVSMQIYNRLGDKLYDASGSDVSWDGTFHGIPCQQDVYVYSIILSGQKNGSQITEQLSGNVTLLR